jgi:hypothetical protein
MFCDPLVFRFIPESGNLKLLPPRRAGAALLRFEGAGLDSTSSTVWGGCPALRSCVWVLGYQGERLNLDFDEDHLLSIISAVIYGGFSNRPVFGKNPIQCII